MKKLIAWLKSPSSDLLLFILILVMVNLIGAGMYFRIDLTSQKSFSLSRLSKELVRSLEEPLTVNVFFSDNLPAVYKSTGQYLNDILTEYEGASSGNFSCTFFDMDKPENQDLAAGYGITQVQIQEFSNNELGFKNAYMGIAVTYRDRIEIINEISSEEGLEYKLTSLFSQMIAESNALEGLDGKIGMCLYATKALGSFSISGFDTLESEVLRAYTKLNSENMDRISFRSESPGDADAVSVAERYGLQYLTWENPSVAGKTSSGVIGLVLEYGGEFRTIPLRLARSIFGGYGITGLDSLDDNLSAALKSLVSKTMTVGYITGHGEIPLSSPAAGNSLMNNELNAANFAANASDRYEFEEITLAENEVPAGIDCLIINGPKTPFTEEELYKLDQFLMAGGNLMVFLDPFEIVSPPGEQAYYTQPQFLPIQTGLETILAKYGISMGNNYVLDLKCYEDLNMRGGPGAFLYYIPVVERTGMNQKHPISENLSYVLFLQPSSIVLEENETDENGKLLKTVLAKSSPDSWLAENPESFGYDLMTPPSGETDLGSKNLAVLVEGEFSSAYGSAPETGTSGDSGQLAEKEEDAGMKATQVHLSGSIRPGKIFAAGSSAITTQQVVDQAGSQPIAVFLRNVLDYMNGAEDFCTMRTKGMSLNTLNVKQGASVQAAKIFNQYGLPVLVAVFGLLAWRHRSRRRKIIRIRYEELKSGWNSQNGAADVTTVDSGKNLTDRKDGADNDQA